MKNLRLLFLIGVILMHNCKENKSSDNELEKNVIDKNESILRQENNSQVAEDFRAFFKNFLKDSIFRDTRVHFPMKGFNSDAEGDRENYEWTKKEWEFYLSIDKEYETNENIISELIPEDSVKIWRLYKENSGYDIKYFFKLKKGKWYLDYYSYKNF